MLGSGPDQTRGVLESLGLRLLNTLIPPSCTSCGAEATTADGLCGTCWAQITFVTPPFCITCGFPFGFAIAADSQCARCMASAPVFSRGRSAALYDSVARELVLVLKHADRLDVAPTLAHWLLRTGGPLLEDADLLIPVPLHSFRVMSRGFNQSTVLAGHLSRISGVPAMTHALVRRRRTVSQQGLSRTARERNVAGAFALTRHGRRILPGRRVVLIDDVYTTGATLDACARTLLREGVADVRALTVARVARPSQAPI